MQSSIFLIYYANISCFNVFHKGELKQGETKRGSFFLDLSRFCTYLCCTNNQYRTMRNIIICIITMLFVACSSNELEERMGEIRTMGNRNPRQALQMLDSIETDIRKSPEYLQKEYDLLCIRLHDKAYIPATSDIKIKELIDYYGKKGTDLEKQETYYYAGSVYRDLHDTPKAMKYYLQAIETALNAKRCDSIILRNTYSNLHYIYYTVQDYQNALDIAKKEMQIATKLNVLDARTLIHVGASYDHTDSTSQAKRICNLATKHVLQNPEEQTAEFIYTLLYRTSHLNDIENADTLYKIAQRLPIFPKAKDLFYLSEYYLMKNKVDSAITCYCKVVDDSFLEEKYNALKRLIRIYHKRGDDKQTAKYAVAFADACTALDLGKRQEMAATVNNMYQYNKSEREEQRMREEQEQARHLLVVIFLLSSLIILIVIALYIYRRNKRLHEMLSLTHALTRLKEEKSELEESIAQSNRELERQRESLREKDRELEQMNQEIGRYDTELKEKERQLEDRIEQNKTFVRLLHQSELESSAEEVTRGIKEAARGKRQMSNSDWRQLYRAVDELYPTFHEELIQKLGRIGEQQIQVCYLMRIGLSNIQIQNLTNLSRVTIWRWVKRFGEKLNL